MAPSRFCVLGLQETNRIGDASNSTSATLWKESPMRVIQDASTESSQEGRRFDEAAERTVFERAIRLQTEALHPEQAPLPHTNQEAVEGRTEAEIIAIAAEAGIEPAYIRRALAEHTSSRSRDLPRTQTAPQVSARQSLQRRLSVQRTERALLWGGYGLPLAYGTVAYALRHDPEWAQFLTMVASAPTCLLLGFLMPRKRLGAIAALLLVIALTSTFHEIVGTGLAAILFADIPFEPAREFRIVLVGAGLAMLLGIAGAWSRQQAFREELSLTRDSGTVREDTPESDPFPITSS